MVLYGTPVTCLTTFDRIPISQVLLTVEIVWIAFLILLIIYWARSQKRTPYQFAVLKWHNYGLALLSQLLYVLLAFSHLFVTACSLATLPDDTYRMLIVSEVFYWLAMLLTLHVLLSPLPAGLARLSSRPRSSPAWLPRILIALFATFAAVYLALFIWNWTSAIDVWDAYVAADGFELPDRLFAFPQVAYIRVALTTVWFLLALFGVVRCVRALWAAEAEWRVPTGVKAWVYGFGAAVFVFGFGRTFFAYWNALGDVPEWWEEEKLLVDAAVNDVWLMVGWVAVGGAAAKVAGWGSSLLAYPEAYGVGVGGVKEGEGAVGDEERGLRP